MNPAFVVFFMLNLATAVAYVATEVAALLH